MRPVSTTGELMSSMTNDEVMLHEKFVQIFTTPSEYDQNSRLIMDHDSN
jgi:hypothetical protein